MIFNLENLSWHKGKNLIGTIAKTPVFYLDYKMLVKVVKIAAQAVEKWSLVLHHMDRSIILLEWSDVEIYVHLGAEAAVQRCLRKRCFENMQLATILQLHWNRTSAWVFSCKFAAYSPVYSLKMVTGKCNRNISIFL